MTLVSADGREKVIEAGESYVLAGEEAHAAENRGEEDVVGIDIFSPPRTDPDWQT
jgi:quercetin dioxygenase-like cupin family protein